MTIWFSTTTVVLPNPTALQITREEADDNEWTFTCLSQDLAALEAITDLAGVCTTSRLLSGKLAVQTTGTQGTLSIDGTAYTNVAIKGSSKIQEIGNGWYSLKLTFVQETASS